MQQRNSQIWSAHTLRELFLDPPAIPLYPETDGNTNFHSLISRLLNLPTELVLDILDCLELHYLLHLFSYTRQHPRLSIELFAHTLWGRLMLKKGQEQSNFEDSILIFKLYLRILGIISYNETQRHRELIPTAARCHAIFGPKILRILFAETRPFIQKICICSRQNHVFIIPKGYCSCLEDPEISPRKMTFAEFFRKSLTPIRTSRFDTTWDKYLASIDYEGQNPSNTSDILRSAYRGAGILLKKQIENNRKMKAQLIRLAIVVEQYPNFLRFGGSSSETAFNFSDSKNHTMASFLRQEAEKVGNHSVKTCDPEIRKWFNSNQDGQSFFAIERFCSTMAALIPLDYWIRVYMHGITSHPPLYGDVSFTKGRDELNHFYGWLAHQHSKIAPVLCRYGCIWSTVLGWNQNRFTSLMKDVEKRLSLKSLKQRSDAIPHPYPDHILEAIQKTNQGLFITHSNVEKYRIPRVQLICPWDVDTSTRADMHPYGFTGVKDEPEISNSAGSWIIHEDKSRTERDAFQPFAEEELEWLESFLLAVKYISDSFYPFAENKLLEVMKQRYECENADQNPFELVEPTKPNLGEECVLNPSTSEDDLIRIWVSKPKPDKAIIFRGQGLEHLNDVFMSHTD